MDKPSDKKLEEIAKLKENDVGLLIFKDDKEILDYLKKAGLVVDVTNGLVAEKTAAETKPPQPEKKIRGIPETLDAWKRAWSDFYQNVWKMKLDFSNLTIPIQPTDSNLVIVASGLTGEVVVERFAKKQELIKQIQAGRLQSCRYADKGSYAVWLDNDPNPITTWGQELDFRSEYPRNSTLEEELLWRMFQKEQKIDVEPLGTNQFVACLGSLGKYQGKSGFPKIGVQSSKSRVSYDNYYSDYGPYRTILRKGGLCLSIFARQGKKDDDAEIFVRSVVL